MKAAEADIAGGNSLIQEGVRFKPDVRRVMAGGAPAILKDYSGRSRPARAFGRLMVRREVRVLERLRGLPGIPACGGLAGVHGLLLEPIEGERITRWCQRHPDGAGAMFERLAALVAEMHRRGVMHLDLRKRDNILVGPDGRPHLIDFNASICVDPRGLPGRLALRWLGRVDTGAVLKWRARLAPHLLGPGEARRYRRQSLLRRLWIFN